MKKFYDIYTKEEIYNAMNNKFLLNFKYKINGKILISKKFGIVIRNVNKIESDILSNSLVEQINRILSLFKDYEIIFDESKLKKIKKDYLKKFTDFNNNTMIRYNLYGAEISNIFDKLISIIKEQIRNVKSNSCDNISKEIAKLYVDNCLVLYSEKEELIYNMISDYTNNSKEDIDDFGKYNDFIYRYMELWNSINFNQHEYFGIKINIFSTRLEQVLDLRIIEKMEIFKECTKVLNSPISIDIKNDKLFYLIVNRFCADYYTDADTKILLYFSLLELLLTHRQIGLFDSSINKQLCNNILLCSKKYQQILVSNKEIRELYNYRSLLIHGDLDNIQKSLRKIRKFEFAKSLINDLEYYELDDENSYIRDIIRIRVLELFSYIYKIYCIDEDFINSLKKRKNIFQRIKNI